MAYVSPSSSKRLSMNHVVMELQQLTEIAGSTYWNYSPGSVVQFT